MSKMKRKSIVIIGGGAAGIFASLRCAELAHELNLKLDIRVYESANNVLRKLKISGGGRCNVTHNCFEVNDFVKNYPRGEKELLSPFRQFQAQDTVNWFKKEDITLVAEEDGRMFPQTNKSETIINCFMKKAEKYGVKIILNSGVEGVESLGPNQFNLKFKNTSSDMINLLLVATGSAPSGYKLSKNLGHKISKLAPSLFSFKIKSLLLEDLSGTSFAKVYLKLKLGKYSFKQKGPLLITHWGLSGPAILKLSAWSAREMKELNYRGVLTVNWTGLEKEVEVRQLIMDLKEKNLKSNIGNIYPNMFTKNFWKKILAVNKISSDKPWSELSKQQMNKIIQLLYAYSFEVTGKNRFKDEFVECGGVTLKEVNLKTMESKICEGLYFAGELLDIDGITGGFNFQNAWTTGWIAATHMISKIQALD